ncbi:UDP-N-acetyl-D-glucosamine dehydrogenase [Candidatus Planktophila sulfonica]|uniref:UDP-N-acetyl-D-glucosamine dehydrogenase n=1 Tax=Candidatus Planktophila sulfonica TaxID=1884904 RepID=A0A249KF05_9ACTN|nr:nucleotide sugar dehydrogenase [Candidatus Planktophila sulfonica]ASY15381.1 UDP-N-acetyl-D-glucosamine dehydrogenase [Candidatus Planktophila sulfonica]
MKVAVIGQGYVGLTISAFAGKYFEVIGFDNNQRIVDQLNLGISHIEGVDSDLLSKWIKAGRYRATTKGSDIEDAAIVVIAVPTPLTKDRQPDLAFIDAACKSIGENVKKPVLVINESTSFPGTLRNYIKPAIQKYSKSPVEHLYAISPERVDPGRGDYNQKNTPRLYAGLTPEASEKTRSFYSKFCDELVEVSSPEVAEAAKLFENTFRQVNIALVNEFAQIAHSLGISVYETLEAANTKPYGFMKFTPSAGVGGHCIPVDPTYLAAVAEKHGAPATFIRRANEVNLEMSKYVVDRVQADNGGSLQGKSVLVVGVAYKPNVADVRETAAELVIEHLRERGAVVSWHDDVVGSWNGEKSSPLSGADIAVVITKHEEVQVRDILASAPYVFDTTGKVVGAHGL